MLSAHALQKLPPLPHRLTAGRQQSFELCGGRGISDPLISPTLLQRRRRDHYIFLNSITCLGKLAMRKFLRNRFEDNTGHQLRRINNDDIFF
jgi:hypothetical protein